MAWFKRDNKSLDQPNRRKNAVADGMLVGQVRDLAHDRVSQGLGSDPACLPEVSVPVQNVRQASG